MNEFLLGTLVGLVQTVVGHPLDTLKTIYQNQSQVGSRKFPVTTLYRGVSYPMVSSVITNGFLFYSQDNINFFFKNNFISGFVSGFMVSPLINIFEVYKIRKQIGNNKTNKIFFKKDLLCLGLSATSTRESIGACLYFGSYNYLHDKKKYSPFFSGSIAGLTSWFFTYPIDVIKTRLQSGESYDWKSAINKGNLTSGLGVCLCRSIIVNGFSFMVYENFKHQKNQQS